MARDGASVFGLGEYEAGRSWRMISGVCRLSRYWAWEYAPAQSFVGRDCYGGRMPPVHYVRGGAVFLISAPTVSGESGFFAFYEPGEWLPQFLKREDSG